MRKKGKSLTVFFNASVVLAGLKSPKGASAKLISWAQQKKIKGVTSEIILDEIERNLERLSLSKRVLEREISAFRIRLAPKASAVEKYRRVAVDHGDAHVLASAEEVKADYLVSLDKKHILILKQKIEKIKIRSPGELVKYLSQTLVDIF